MLNLLKYEIGVLRWVDRVENNILSMGFEGGFTSPNGANMYELFEIVLDDLGLTSDSELEYPGRDPYLDLYFQAWTDPLFDTKPDKVVKKLLDNIMKEFKKPIRRKKK